MWIKPPAVPVINPSTHKMIKITASVYNIKISFGWVAGWRAFAPAGNQLAG